MWLVVTEYWNGRHCMCCQIREDRLEEFGTEAEAMDYAKDYPERFPSERDGGTRLKAIYKCKQVYPKPRDESRCENASQRSTSGS